MKDPIGDRIKSKFEDPFRYAIPQRVYGLLRLDGKAFHTFTRGLPKPYCNELSAVMDTAATALAKEIMGCKLAYGQSDEYSFLFTDFDKEESETWFAGNVQKIASVSASIFTAHFNQEWARVLTFDEPKIKDPINAMNKLAVFDARVFVIPRREDVISYFNWRQLDASRNSLNMLASTKFSHKELQSKGAAVVHDMLHEIGVNWNDYPVPMKRGRVIRRVPSTRTISYTHKKTKELKTQVVEDMAWEVDNNIPVFSRNKDYLEGLIP